jgi:hypothetical protein
MLASDPTDVLRGVYTFGGDHSPLKATRLVAREVEKRLH